MKPLIVLPQVNEVTFYTRTPKDYDSRHRKNANCLLQQQQKHYIGRLFFSYFQTTFFFEQLTCDRKYRTDQQRSHFQKRQSDRQ